MKMGKAEPENEIEPGGALGSHTPKGLLPFRNGKKRDQGEGLSRHQKP